VVSSVVANPTNALYGTLLLLAGVPVFLFWQRRAARAARGARTGPA
jgi:basic amino acid/polyamine antiporter, APA family